MIDGGEDALLAARLCAIDPGLGGMILRGGGELRDRVVAELRAGLGAGLGDEAPVRRVPVHIDDERLLGGIDLAATLAEGAVVRRAGLLAEADGGIVIVPMAERLSDATAGRLAAAIDRGARFLTVALDDGIAPDERAPPALAERMAFRIDLASDYDAGRPSTARSEARDPEPARGEAERIATLVATAAALGIESARAAIFALRAARAAARMDGRDAMVDSDVLLAVRLVLAPRATRVPAAQDASANPPPPRDADGGAEEQGIPEAIDDVVLGAALAALPRDLLARIAAGQGARRRPTAARGAGEQRKSEVRGRPMGARAGMPGGGRRLSLIDTLRAAAPWQAIRGATGRRVAVRRDDLRIRRFETRAEMLSIFAVDASGSAALARLAEAKGAVELLLAEAYVKRAQVALVIFRGLGASILLPPTRSLARARRSLADLPGGGGTPLAAGLRAAHDVAEAARARGRTPFVVVLTDGRANIASDGRAVRTAAIADATAAATAIGAAGIDAVFLDIATRPGPEGPALAAAMRARYVALPRADAATMHAAVRAAQAG